MSINHRYKIGEVVYFHLGEEKDEIIKLVSAPGDGDVLGYVLKNEGFLFESSIEYSEKELMKPEATFEDTCLVMHERNQRVIVIHEADGDFLKPPEEGFNLMTHREQVIQLIAKQYCVDPATISEEHILTDDLGGDSLDSLQLVMNIEETLGIEIDDVRWARVATVDDVIQLVEGSI